MLTWLRKSNKSVVIGMLSLAAIASSASADTCLPKGIYLGAFGGGGASTSTNLSQSGTAFFPVASGGALAVNATGSSGSRSTWIAGGHVGYEWPAYLLGTDNSAWGLVPAAELEGYYLDVTQNSSNLNNPTTRLPAHNFNDSFPMHTGVMLANGVFTFKNPCVNWVNLYLGGGVGAGYISISGANSLQTAPAEPGVNHFNSNTNANDWAFAAQAKAGLHFVLSEHWRLFAEYRYLYLSSTNYTFGSTQYPTHVPTTNWNAHVGNMNFNMGAAGLEYNF